MERSSRPVRFFVVLGALIAAILALSAATAMAAPSEPTLGLTDLQAHLDASGTVPGYLKTVVKGSTIVTIPVTVEAITGGASSADTLILFEATGTVIAKFGGIIEGMSGSPIYVDDNGTDKLIGAVSYGDMFTLGGTGLATPIEAMEAIEAYPTQVATTLSLRRPALSAGRVVRQVIVAPDPQDYRVEAQAGALVAKPLTAMYVGGLRPGTKVYEALSAEMAKRGRKLVALTTNAGGIAMSGGVPFSTDLTAGAGIAAMESYGDLWVGGIGTVTYENSDTVLAFGHPMNYSGPTSLFMTNAWIDGVWPSSLAPYKLGRPGAIAGTITQDRNAGILGKVGMSSAVLTVTAEATDLDTGNVATSTVLFSRQYANSPQGDWYIEPDAAYMAGAKLFDQYATPGSVQTTTTIKVSDGTDLYTIVIPNLWDDQYDAAYASLNDLYSALSQLTGVFNWGGQLDIQSIDLQSSFSATHHAARIVGVDLPHGIKIGSNPVRVSLLVFGTAATQTVDTTITIPKGTPLNGTISADSVGDLSGGGMLNYYYYYFGFDGPTSNPTISQIASQLSSASPNTLLTVTYAPADNPYYGSSASSSSKSVVSTMSTTWDVTGGDSKSVAVITAAAYPKVINYGGTAKIRGYVFDGSVGDIVSILGTPSGSATETLLATAKVVYDEYSGELMYSANVKGLGVNTAIRAYAKGDDQTTAAEARTWVLVRARTAITESKTNVKHGAKVLFTAKVSPASTASGTVTFQYLSGRKWHKLADRTLASGAGFASASVSWTPPLGYWSVRAVYAGGPKNQSSVSSVVRIRVTN